MGKLFKKMTPAAKVALIITTAFAFGLLIFGALTPPPGEIHPSILKAVGEMFGFAALWIVAHALFEDKTDVHIKHGDTTVDINTDEEEEQ
jgi:hypothetical protein